MKLLTVAMVLLSVVSCGKTSKVTVDIHGDRISQLEQRIILNEELDKARDKAISLMSIAIQELKNDNVYILGELSRFQFSISSILNSISSLESRVENTESNVNQLKLDVQKIKDDLGILTLVADGLVSSVNDLETQIESLSDRLDEEGVQVFKCNSPSSEERIFRINGVFYAVMNRVTTQNIQFTAPSNSSTSYTTPLLCTSGGSSNLSLGPCGSGKQPVPGSGQTIIVPQGTTVNRTVVTSVKMALEPLTPGVSYQTTDGGPACTFTTDSLIQVQGL